MARARSYLDVIDLRPLVKTSRLRYGALDARGIPAVLFGVAAIVLAAGASATMKKAATMFPETLREGRLLWLTIRPLRPELPDDSANGRGR
ncbi:MAG: hypothetical protein NVSMB19_08000 [Vulcanimicrobiaceae bacterium]